MECETIDVKDETETSQTKALRLVTQYAQNRMDMHSVNCLIRDLLSDESGGHVDVDLTPHREDWMNNCSRWEGWLVAVSNSAEPTKSEEYKLARLLDKKAIIRRECGQIKRNIYANGRSLIF